MTGFVKTKGNKFVEYPYGAAELQRDNPEANYDYFCDFARQRSIPEIEIFASVYTVPAI